MMRGSRIALGLALLAMCSRAADDGDAVMSYLTLWDAQLAQWGFDKDPARLARWLGDVRKSGIGHMVVSVPWARSEPRDGDFDFASAHALVGAVCDAGLRAVVVLDASGGNAQQNPPPAWLGAKLGEEAYRRVGGGPPGEACNLRGTGPSIGSAAVLDLAVRFFEAAVGALSARHGCIRSFSPNFNNELEARYIQHCDIFQDYNDGALAQYRAWLLEQSGGDAAFWTARWDASGRSPGAGRLAPGSLAPPRVWGWTSTAATALDYWDWLRFREVLLARAFTRACDAMVAAGARGCFLHFGELFTTIDAINSVVFYELAAHPSLIDLVLDTNFINFLGVTVEPEVAALLVSTAQPYARADARKKVWFEGAVERLITGGQSGTGDLRGDSLMKRGFQQAVAAGAHGIGITNLQDLSLLPKILPIAPPVSAASMAALRVVPWAPSSLLFTARETFYSYRKYTRKSDKLDALQAKLLHAYKAMRESCGGCQIQVVGDARLLANASFARGFGHRAWLRLPGVLPEVVQRAMAAAAQQASWHVMHYDEQALVALPVMGRPRVFSVGGEDDGDAAAAAAAGARGDAAWAPRHGAAPLKAVVVLSQGRAGSTALLSLLNNCVRDAFVQGENDFSVWWLYKYSLSVASYELCVDRASSSPPLVLGI